LLNAGAKINVQDSNKNSALHYACLFAKIDVIDTLMSRRSLNVELVNIDGKTAF